MWCPVKKMYFKGVKRAIRIFTTIPKNIISAISEPIDFCAMDTIASLFGTIPWMLNPYWNIPEKCPNAPTITDAPAPSTKKPKMLLIKPFTHSEASFFWISKPIKATKPTRTAGTLNTSFIKNRKNPIFSSYREIIFVAESTSNFPNIGLYNLHFR